MKGSLSLFDGSVHAALHDFQISIVRQLKVVNACHDAGEVVVGGVRWFTWLADYSEQRRKVFKACVFSQSCKNGTMWENTYLQLEVSGFP